MNNQKLIITNTSSGEIIETNLELAGQSYNKYAVNGHKCYTKSLLEIHRLLSKREFEYLLEWHSNTSIIGPSNIFKLNFRTITAEMARSSRSTFKKKLFDLDIIVEYGVLKRMMLNPYVFYPRKDKTYQDSQYWSQRVWTYLQNGKDAFTTEVLDYVEHLFDES